MQVIETISEMAEVCKGCVLTIGNFDGVHLGHQKMISELILTAKAMGGCSTAAMTFDPHPVAILHREKAPLVLTPLVMKTELLRQAGLDYLIVLKDSYEMLNLSPVDFVDKFLMAHLEPSVIVEGNDFNFGYGRSGDVDTLKELGAERGFDVRVVEDYMIDCNGEGGQRVSSSNIRHQLLRGNVSEASKGLGRYYRLAGKVVKGRGKGKAIGYATANIEPFNQVVPDEGVYAGYVEIADSFEDVCKKKTGKRSVFSLGRAKTFITEHPLLIEAHVLGEDIDDIYGKWLAMDFVEFIRHQERFETAEELSDQIGKDCEKAKSILQGR